MLIPDASAPSFCYYNSYGKTEKMDREMLRKAILFARKEGLSVNVIAGKEKLPDWVQEELGGIVHAIIAPWEYPHDSVRDVAVIDLVPGAGLPPLPDNREKNYILRVPRERLPELADLINGLKGKCCRVNVQLLDVNRYRDAEFKQYEAVLKALPGLVMESGMEINILTDRLVLSEMNSCGAGDSAITAAPDGKLYPCPGFYYDGAEPCGDVENGLDSADRRLFKLEFAPICKACDAWQCRRCVWMNARATGEVNTPSRGQCVAAHKERHASVLLSAGTSAPLEDVAYEDPLEIVKR